MVVSLLEGYAEQLPASPQETPLQLAVPHLKVIKTAIGVVLNLSLGYGDLRPLLQLLHVLPLTRIKF